MRNFNRKFGSTQNKLKHIPNGDLWIFMALGVPHSSDPFSVSQCAIVEAATP